jgi:ABC-type Mn2+/Zn2+ transport system ATPase subunit
MTTEFTLPQAGSLERPNGAGKSTIFRMIMGEENQMRRVY